MAVETATTLLERERELGEIHGALTEAQQGRGGVVLVEARAGLGKTSLLRAALETAAEAGFTCLRARANELERDFAYGCVRQLLEPVVAKAPDAERDRLFAGAAALSEPLFAPTGAASTASSADSALSMFAWPLLAAQQSGRRASGGPVRRRPALVRRGVAAIPRLPGPALGRSSARRPRFDAAGGGDIRLGTRFALALLIEALIEEGEVEAAEQALASSGYGEDIPPGMASNSLLEARALLHLARGRTHEGLADLLGFGRHDELSGGANPLGSRWRARASLALAAMGDSERARLMALEDLERARRWGAASGIGIALRAAALVEGGEASIARLGEAVEVLAVSPARLEHARALTDLGAALRRANRRAEARRSLEGGLELAERLGARALADQARTELRAAGGRSSDPGGSGLEQLTASERRVAELAADGNSNPEIAQSLFVTRKTVETHLGHAPQARHSGAR